MANWGADFWGAYSDVAKARMAQAAFAQQQQGMSAFGNAMMDPGLFSGGGQGGGVPQQGPSMPAVNGPVPPGGQGVFQGFRQRGLDPIHAAALAGNYQQESNFNPKAWNPYEGAGGMDQWRGNRLSGLKQLASSTGRQWTDPNAQMDFTMREGKTTEAGPWSKFMAAKTLPDANAALKGYIRYGDSSQGTRLANAENILKKYGGDKVAASQSPEMATAVAKDAAPQVMSMGAPGQLNWQHIVQSIMKRNPGIDPVAMANAVQMFEPLMSQQSQMDWREQSLQLREMSLQLAEQRASTQADQGQQRIDVSKAKEAGVDERFKITQDRLYKGYEQRASEFKQKLAAAKTKSDRDYYARQLKANNDQRHQRATEIIQRGSAMQDNPMSAEDQQKALDAENQRWQMEKDQIEADASGSAPQQPYQQGDQHPVPKGAVRAPGVDTLGATGASGGGDTPPQSYLDGGGTAAGWKHMPKEKRSLWQ